jgi:YHS domain-containing protein
MSELTALKERLNNEFAEFHKDVTQFQTAAKTEYESREARFRGQFTPAANRVVELVRPRLQLLVDQFKNKVQVQPAMSAHSREVTLKFDSPVARTDLTFRLGHDAEVKNLVLEQTLEILPILMKFDSHSSITTPLDKLDETKLVQWVDDRIVSFVQTYAAMHQNQFYLKDHLVTDPIAGVQMPKYAAKCTLEIDGKTHYFICDETKREFETKRAAK